MRRSAYADKIADMQKTVKGLSSSVGSKFAYKSGGVQALVECRLL